MFTTRMVHTIQMIQALWRHTSRMPSLHTVAVIRLFEKRLQPNENLGSAALERDHQKK